MSKRDNPKAVRADRRVFLQRLAGAASVAAAGWASRPAFAEDQTLDALIGDTQRGEFGQGFDEASRTIHMPKASEPTVSAATAETTEQAIERYAAIVGVAAGRRCRTGVLRLGDRHPGVSALRARLPPRAISTPMRPATTPTIPTSTPRSGASRRATA